MSTTEHMQRVLLALATADNKSNVQQRDIEEDEELRIEKALEQLRGQTRAPPSQAPAGSTPTNASAVSMTLSQAPEQGKDEDNSGVPATPVDSANEADTVLPVSQGASTVGSVPTDVIPHGSDTSFAGAEAGPQTQPSIVNSSQTVPVEVSQVDQLEGAAFVDAPRDSNSIIAKESNAESEIVLQSRAEVQSISPTLVESHLSDVITPSDVTQQAESLPSEVAPAMEQQAEPLPAVTTPSAAIAQSVDPLPAEATPSPEEGLEEPNPVEVTPSETESSNFQAKATYQPGVTPSAMEQQAEPLLTEVTPSAMEQQAEPVPAKVAPSAMEQQAEPVPTEVALSAMEQQAQAMPAVVVPSAMEQQAEPVSAEVAPSAMEQQVMPAEVMPAMEQQTESVPAEVVPVVEQPAESLPGEVAPVEPVSADTTSSAMTQLGEPMEIEVTLSEQESSKSRGEATNLAPLEPLPIVEPQTIAVASMSHPSQTEATQSQQEGHSIVTPSQPVVKAQKTVAVPGESVPQVLPKVAGISEPAVPQQIPKRPTASTPSESKKSSGRSGSNRSQHSGRGGGRGRGSSRRRSNRPNSSSGARSRRDFGGAAVSPYADQPPSKRGRRDPGAPSPILPNGPAVLIILLGTAQRSYAEYCRSEVDRAGFSVGIRYLDRQPLSLTLSRAFQEGIRFIIIIGKDNEQSNTVSFKIVSESQSEKRQSVVMPLRRAINAMLDMERPQLSPPRRRRYERYPMPREASYAPTLARSPPRRLAYAPPDARLPPSGPPPPRYHGYEPQAPAVYESRSRYPPARRGAVSSPPGRRSGADVVPEVQAISNLLSYFDSQTPPPAPGAGYGAYEPHHHQPAASPYASSSYYKDDGHGMSPLPPLPHSYRSLPPPHRRTEPYDAVYSRR